MARGHALIVDDSSTARIILARLLERADLTTKGVVSAEEGLTQLREEAFDLVFLDHLLPGMNGLEALDVIKADSELRHIPVFMYTSQSAERYRQDAKARGAAGVIGKQVDREQLLTTIEAILTDASTLPSLSPIDNNTGELIEQSYTRRLTGRLATLEIAYEETHDELRQLRKSVALLEAMHQEGLDGQRNRLKWLAIGSVAGLAGIVLFFGLELRDLSILLESLNGQLAVMQEIVGSLVELEEVSRQ
ncbi:MULTISPECIES: response regulator [Marinobacter]|jgi:CheY-like chemotaxis protein|uniref:response regulator n=1 Tax=Marinobacter TaxID=2742 RepID=UPI00055E4F63|nr:MULTISPECIES: response regulator [Marinobacter]MCZ4286763.1 response regulator [Marinobacter salarius]MDM8180600.1 response regulator [Marinobacter salarius]RUT74318.1 response regulator [Marinobacter sp. NP-6]VVS95887.1 Chemotaxis protein CheY [Marinobacter salarius]VXC53440.1 Response regulator [Marinobacter salarius]